MTHLTVSEVNAHVKGLIENDFKLSGISVKGEISNLGRRPQGHLFFNIKDDKAQLNAVMWASDAARLKFAPEVGARVVAQGRVTVYEQRGEYRLVVRDLRLDGVGDLYAAFLKLKEKLEREGLFDPSRKRPLPRLPARIGLITSPTGAALRDMVTTIRRRHAGVSVLLSPALVQGADAPQSIVAAMGRLCEAHRAGTAIDAIIVGRGGGSYEDLVAFNDEAVARAIAACPIPVVSGVGHETDTTIADFVADVRAATPTAAAELVTPERAALLQAVSALQGRLRNALVRRLGRARDLLDRVEARRRMLTAGRLLDARRLRLDELTDRLGHGAMQQVRRKQAALAAHAGRLDALSPLKVLSRGYVVCRTTEGDVVTRVAQAWEGRALELVLRDGRASVRVEETRTEASAPDRPAERGTE